LAVRAKEPPAQIRPLFTVTTGKEFTLTVEEAVSTQPFTSVPVTMYTIELPGEAVTELPEVALSPAFGLQEYELAPPAVKEAEEPAQIVALFTVTTGKAFTVTVELATAVQEPTVPVTV
jgi:hypothetical protein